MARRTVIIAALVAGALFAWTLPASAQSFIGESAEVRMNIPATLFTAAASAVPAQPPAPASTVATAVDLRPAPKSSLLAGSLVGLYATTVTLQMLDVRSTYAVIERGGAEGNPMMARVVQNKPAFVAVKAAIAASTILAARQVARHSKVAAVVTLVAVNTAYASVVAHNFNLARQMQ